MGALQTFDISLLQHSNLMFEGKDCVGVGKADDHLQLLGYTVTVKFLNLVFATWPLMTFLDSSHD